MSQAKEPFKSHSDFQKYTLRELGIDAWSLSDAAALSSEVAESLDIDLSESSQSGNMEVSAPAPATTSKETASDVLKRLSGDLTKQKPVQQNAPEITEQCPPQAEPAPKVLNEWLLQCTSGTLQADIEQAFNLLGIPYVTKAYDEPVQYRGVICDKSESTMTSGQVFSEQGFKSPEAKKRLWQHLSQDQKSPS